MHAVAALERTAHALQIAKTAACRDMFQGQVFMQQTARMIDTHPLDKLGGGLVQLTLEMA